MTTNTYSYHEVTDKKSLLFLSRTHKDTNKTEHALKISTLVRFFNITARSGKFFHMAEVMVGTKTYRVFTNQLRTSQSGEHFIWLDPSSDKNKISQTSGFEKGSGYITMTHKQLIDELSQKELV